MMSHFEEFGKLISEKVAPARARMREAPGALEAFWARLMWDLGPLHDDADVRPKGRSAVDLAEDERKWLDVQDAYWEVDEAVDRLKLAEAYLRKRPSARWLRSEGILGTVYVAYHVENYIQETYILEDRVRRLIAKVRRVCADQTAVDTVAEVVTPGLRLLRRLRGMHVHEHRLYRPQACALRALEEAPRLDASLRRALLLASRLHRLRWANETKRWNYLVEQLSDYLFGELTRVVNLQ